MKRLNFSMQHQMMSNWCWAAVTSSVDEWSISQSTTPSAAQSAVPQCRLATALLNQPDGASCCGANPDLTKCNQPLRLQNALSFVGRLAGEPLPRQLTFEEIRTQIDSDNPVCIRIVWRSRLSAHFVVISGYDIQADGEPTVFLEDPFSGGRQMPFRRLQSREPQDGYLGEGDWVASYRVTAHGSALAAV